MCLLLMDESGDTGMKLDEGSSPAFTICLVLFADVAQAEACRARIQLLRAELGVKMSGKASEFHFHKGTHERRMSFLAAVADFTFRYFTATVDKARVPDRLWHKKDYMYQRTAEMALGLVKNDLLEANLYFDATSSRTFDWELLRAIKKYAGTYESLPVIKDVKRLDSHKDDLIQLVDMVCGAAMAVDGSYRRLIRSRFGASLVFPEAEFNETTPKTC